MPEDGRSVPQLPTTMFVMFMKPVNIQSLSTMLAGDLSRGSKKSKPRQAPTFFPNLPLLGTKSIIVRMPNQRCLLWKQRHWTHRMKLLNPRKMMTKWELKLRELPKKQRERLKPKTFFRKETT